MRLTEFFLNELEREVDRSRKALEEVPDGKYDWRPHEKSMQFGYLADMVARMPTWLSMQIRQDELDVAPADGSRMRQHQEETRGELLQALEESAAAARAAIENTSDSHLMTPWRLLAKGKVVAEAPRHLMLQDTMNHWAHHRGQMTVYLRLMGEKVPALYGPSADDNRFQ
ncbi:MAG: damage-inducible protein DinB [Blastocatellia bacterium]|nr:MAG: damage-inducible protein DinB [Blastocatellia bacterium]